MGEGIENHPSSLKELTDILLLEVLQFLLQISYKVYSSMI
jgi:hypothetical protein